MKKIKFYLFCAKNMTTMIWSKIIVRFGYKYDNSVIPNGLYCYSYADEKNAFETLVNEGHFDYVPCKYYKQVGKSFNGCQYKGIITDDSEFDDQCKMCGQNYEF